MPISLEIEDVKEKNLIQKSVLDNFSIIIDENNYAVPNASAEKMKI